MDEKRQLESNLSELRSNFLISYRALKYFVLSTIILKLDTKGFESLVHKIPSVGMNCFGPILNVGRRNELTIVIKKITMRKKCSLV